MGDKTIDRRLRRTAVAIALVGAMASGGCATSHHGGDPMEDLNHGLSVAFGVAILGGLLYLGATHDRDDCHRRSYDCRCGRH
jgi:hypothetical protein